MMRVDKYKNISSLQNHVFCEHAKKFTSFLELLEFQKTSHTCNSYDISMSDGSRNQRNYDEVSVGADCQINYFHVILMETIIQIIDILRELLFP